MEITTRGARNNNPLNIRYNPSNFWLGQLNPDTSGFCRFKSLHYGIRAALKILYRYIIVYKLTTLELIVSKWAPACENDVEAYIKSVCRLTKFDRNMRIEWKRECIVPLVQAMARVESIMKIDEKQILEVSTTLNPIPKL